MKQFSSELAKSFFLAFNVALNWDFFFDFICLPANQLCKWQWLDLCPRKLAANLTSIENSRRLWSTPRTARFIALILINLHIRECLNRFRICYAFHFSSFFFIVTLLSLRSTWLNLFEFIWWVFLESDVKAFYFCDDDDYHYFYCRLGRDAIKCF